MRLTKRDIAALATVAGAGVGGTCLHTLNTTHIDIRWLVSLRGSQRNRTVDENEDQLRLMIASSSPREEEEGRSIGESSQIETQRMANTPDLAGPSPSSSSAPALLRPPPCVVPSPLLTIDSLRFDEAYQCPPSQVLINSPRSAYVLLRNGLSVSQVTAVDPGRLRKQAGLEGLCPEAVALRLEAEDERRMHRLQVVTTEYAEVRAAVPLEEVVQRVREFAFQAFVHAQTEPHQIQRLVAGGGGRGSSTTAGGGGDATTAGRKGSPTAAATPLRGQDTQKQKHGGRSNSATTVTDCDAGRSGEGPSSRRAKTSMDGNNGDCDVGTAANDGRSEGNGTNGSSSLGPLVLPSPFSSTANRARGTLIRSPSSVTDSFESGSPAQASRHNNTQNGGGAAAPNGSSSPMHNRTTSRSLAACAPIGPRGQHYLDDACVAAAGKALNRTAADVRRVLRQKELMVQQQAAREHQVYQSEAEAIERTRQLREDARREQIKRHETLRSKDKAFRDRVAAIRRREKEEIRQKALHIQQRDSAVTSRIDAIKAHRDEANIVVKEERRGHRDAVKKKDDEQQQRRREQLVQASEEARLKHEETVARRREETAERNRQKAALAHALQEAVQEAQLLHKEQTEHRRDAVEREVEERHSAFQHRRDLRLQAQRELNEHRTNRSRFSREVAEERYQARLEVIKSNYEERIETVEGIKRDKEKEARVQKEALCQMRTSKKEEQQRVDKASAFAFLGYVTDNSAKSLAVQHEKTRRDVLTGHVRSEREALSRALQRTLGTIEAENAVRMKDECSALHQI